MELQKQVTETTERELQRFSGVASTAAFGSPSHSQPNPTDLVRDTVAPVLDRVRQFEMQLERHATELVRSQAAQSEDRASFLAAFASHQATLLSQQQPPQSQ